MSAVTDPNAAPDPTDRPGDRPEPDAAGHREQQVGTGDDRAYSLVVTKRLLRGYGPLAVLALALLLMALLIPTQGSPGTSPDPIPDPIESSP